MVLKPCAAETTKGGDSSNLEEVIESMEAATSMVLKPCSAGTKRKAEFDLEEEEEKSAAEIEERIRKAKIDELEAEKALLLEPEWDVDSFDGLEYHSSPSREPYLSSDEQPYPDMEQPYPDMEQPRKDYRTYKRHIIESKGFYVDPTLRPIDTYKGIFPEKLDRGGSNNRTYRNTCEDMVNVCLQKHNQVKDSNVEFVELVRGNYRGGPRAKSYITFKAREKPDGPIVEYQAKAMRTLDMKIHPILCRPAPTPPELY